MKNVLVAIDFSDELDPVIQAARELAMAFSAKLWLVHIAAPEPDFVGYRAGPQTVRDAVASELRDEHRHLQQLAAGLRRSGIETTALLVQGPTVDTLLEEARRSRADHIVIGSQGRGAISRTLLGSVSEGVVRKAPCSVTVVRSAIGAESSGSDSD